MTTGYGRMVGRRGALGLLGLAAAGPRAIAAGVAAPPTLQPGVLLVGTYFVNPPFEFVDHGARVGFEVDLLGRIASVIGVRAVFENTEWETILGQMRQRRYDCIVGGITITPDRQATLAWSTPYLTTTLSLIVDRVHGRDLHGIADLRGRTVGVQAATTDADAAAAMQRDGRIGAVRVYPFARIGDAVTDLRAGRIAAVMKVRPVADWFVRHNPGLRVLAQVPDDPQPLGIGFAQDTPVLRDAVDGALAGLRRDGGFAALARRWDIRDAD